MLPDAPKRDLLKFSIHLVGSEDIDPLYPVLRALIEEQGLDEEEGLWLSFLYVAWYNLPSAWRAFTTCPEPDPRIVEELENAWPTGTERRSNRGGKVRGHIASYLEAIGRGKQHEWLTQGLRSARNTQRMNDNWRVLNERLQSLHGNGRWAAYKACEVYQKVNGIEVEAPDMGHRFSSGPRQGLALLYGPLEGQDDRTVARLDRQGESLTGWLQRHRLDVSVQEVETILCNWKALVHGRYYVGHDIDELQEQITVAVERDILTEQEAAPLWHAREVALPHRYLGEHHGWHGVDKKRNKAYRDRGVVLYRKDK